MQKITKKFGDSYFGYAQMPISCSNVSLLHSTIQTVIILGLSTNEPLPSIIHHINHITGDPLHTIILKIPVSHLVAWDKGTLTLLHH